MMNRIAENFFKHGFTKLDGPFEETDLYKFLNYVYGPLIYTENINPYFLSVCKYQNETWLMEKVFYDMPLAHNVESVKNLAGKQLNEVGCWVPSKMPNIHSDWDTDFVKGEKLSKAGYLVETVNDWDWEIIKKLSNIKVNKKYQDRAQTYRATERFSDHPPADGVFEEIERVFLKYLPKSPVLKNMNFFNAQFASYPSDVEIDAHGDSDMSCLANMVTHHSEDPTSHKETHIGTYDWYPKIMTDIEQRSLGETDVGKNSVPEPHSKIICKNKQVIIFNFFNPRYYHYVPPTKGDNQRVNLLFGSYSEIMDYRIIDW